MPRMGYRQLLFFRGIAQCLAGVLPDRLEHGDPIACAIDLDKTLVCQRAQVLEHGIVTCTHGLDVLDGGAATEDGHAPEEALLRGGQQRVAPVDRGAQRALTVRRVPGTDRQQSQGMVQSSQ